MRFVFYILLLVLVPASLSFIDRRIKGTGSILSKLSSVVLVGAFIFLSVYLYGQKILDSFHVNERSFTNIKLFTSSRAIALIAILLLFLCFAFSLVFISIRFSKENIIKTSKAEKVSAVLLVVFDVFLIPNILSSVLGANLFAILMVIGTGLVLLKLVFSYTSNNKMEVLAWIIY